MTTTDKMTVSGPLFVILLIHWEVVKWICSLFLGHLAIGRKDCGSEVLLIHLFLPQVLATNTTLHDHHRQDDYLGTTVCHSFDPLGGGKMDLQFILYFFWPLAGRIVAQTSEELTCVCPNSCGHKSNTP
jgi:hypothetical protein